jgi:signal transduction histidine kinase
MFFESTRFFQNQANSKNIEFNNEIDKDFFLLTDPNVLRIAINNIIDNAIKFTEFGRIDFRAYRDEKNVIISIQDTGVGIGEEHLKRLNEGEYFSSSGTKNEKGKGFGLSAIRKLLSEMGGVIKIESEEGKGTSIFIYLPKEERKPSDS